MHYPERGAFLKLWDGDFCMAQQTLKSLEEYKPPAHIRDIFLRDVIVSYARPFLDCYGKEAPKKQRLEKEIYIPGEHLDLHQRIIDFRWHVVGHTDLTWYNPQIANFSSGEKKWFPMAFKRPDYDTLKDEIGRILDLIAIIRKTLHEEIFKIEAAVKA